MASPDEAAQRLRSLANLVEGNARGLAKRVALAVDTAVVLATPVLTGRARANWLCSDNGPNDAVKYAAPRKPPSPEAGAQESLDGGRAIIGQWDGLGKMHITNNLPYIVRLNQGYSAQAPAGYVEQGVLAARRAIDSAGEITAGVITEKL